MKEQFTKKLLMKATFKWSGGFLLEYNRNRTVAEIRDKDKNLGNLEIVDQFHIFLKLVL